MKQSEIIVGKTYFFHNTDVEHRKSMVGTNVTVVGKKKGKLRPSSHGGVITGYGNSPIKFKLSNGKYCTAGNLRPLKIRNEL